MASINEIVQEIEKFRNARDWKQFHNFKDMSLSLVLEAAEVLEHFQWKNPSEVEEYARDNKDKIGEELADCLYWILLLSHDLNIDILAALKQKIDKNAEKYPVEKAKGTHAKYNQL